MSRTFRVTCNCFICHGKYTTELNVFTTILKDWIISLIEFQWKQLKLTFLLLAQPDKWIVWWISIHLYQWSWKYLAVMPVFLRSSCISRYKWPSAVLYIPNPGLKSDSLHYAMLLLIEFVCNHSGESQFSEVFIFAGENFKSISQVIQGSHILSVENLRSTFNVIKLFFWGTATALKQEMIIMIWQTE